uniref:Zona pellucida glycoprotein 3e n=1 Tax=Sinocyclocheilus anshuiensis TaxID=1608454 RepID=A0A671QIL8_9TELE
MGLRQAVFGKLLVFVLGLSEAQWQGRSMQNPVMLKLQQPVPGSLQPETRMSRSPPKYDPNSPVLAPQRFPIKTQARSFSEGRLNSGFLGVLMTGWPSNQYFLSDIINFEASVRSYNHVPFRVCVDNYVATAVPDVSAAPRYPLLRIKGKECMVDAKITGSKSHFMTQSQGDKLQFQLEAFRFQQVDCVYITCIVKATAASNPTSPEQKACSWVSSDESDQVCDCCDTTCSTRSGIDNVSAGPVSRGGLMF